MNNRSGIVMRHHLHLAALCSVLLALGACAPGADLPPLPQDAHAEFRVGAGDQIRIITVGEDVLTGDFRISDSGNIAVPLLGAVRAAGLTPAALGTRIANELKSKNLFKNPSVSVEVLTYRPFFILGEVTKPGQYAYQPDMTVLTAVAVGGGFTYRAIEGYASIVRRIGDKAVEGKVGRQTLVQPGDTITIFQRRF